MTHFRPVIAKHAPFACLLSSSRGGNPQLAAMGIAVSGTGYPSKRLKRTGVERKEKR
jgi:hypothetical protein